MLAVQKGPGPPTTVGVAEGEGGEEAEGGEGKWEREKESKENGKRDGERKMKNMIGGSGASRGK